MKHVWEVWYDFDVWGNPDDGFEVNDHTRLGTIELDDDDLDSNDTLLEAILKGVSRWFDQVKVRKANPVLDWEGTGTMLLDLAHDDGACEPFLELHLKEKDKEAS